VGDLEDNFAKLLGRTPTDRSRQNIYRVRDALNIKPTDSVWMLLMALEHYEMLYEDIPGKITTAAREVVAGVRSAAEAEAAAARAETAKALMRAVHEAAVKSTKQAAGAYLAKWVSIGVGVTALAGTLLCWAAARRGEETGRAVGGDLARRQCGALVAASSWANTPEGQLAYAMAKAGGLAEVARCSGRGMVPRDGWCVVASERGRPLARWAVAGSVTRTSGGNP
jgi:hypothetical protein